MFVSICTQANYAMAVAPAIYSISGKNGRAGCDMHAVPQYLSVREWQRKNVFNKLCGTMFVSICTQANYATAVVPAICSISGKNGRAGYNMHAVPQYLSVREWQRKNVFNKLCGTMFVSICTQANYATAVAPAIYSISGKNGRAGCNMHAVPQYLSVRAWQRKTVFNKLCGTMFVSICTQANYATAVAPAIYSISGKNGRAGYNMHAVPQYLSVRAWQRKTVFNKLCGTMFVSICTQANYATAVAPAICSIYDKNGRAGYNMHAVPQYLSVRAWQRKNVFNKLCGTMFVSICTQANYATAVAPAICSIYDKNGRAGCDIHAVPQYLSVRFVTEEKRFQKIVRNHAHIYLYSS